MPTIVTTTTSAVIPNGYVPRGTQGHFYKAVLGSEDETSKVLANADCESDNAWLMTPDTLENLEIAQQFIRNNIILISWIWHLHLYNVFLEEHGEIGNVKFWTGLSNPTQTPCNDAGCEAFWVKQDGSG